MKMIFLRIDALSFTINLHDNRICVNGKCLIFGAQKTFIEGSKVLGRFRSLGMLGER